jgi:hypothetical protein
MTRTSAGRMTAVSNTHQSVEGSRGSGATGGLQRRPSGEVERATRAPEWYQRSQSPAGSRLTTGEPAPRRSRPRETAGCWVGAWQRRGEASRQRGGGRRAAGSMAPPPGENVTRGGFVGLGRAFPVGLGGFVGGGEKRETGLLLV